MTGWAEEAALAAEAHVDAEAVDACIVAAEGLGELQFVSREEGALDEAHYCVAALSVDNLRVGCDVLEVDGFESEFGVQLAEVSVAVAAQVVVDAIGDVAGLLDFGNDHSCADSMDSTCGDVEAVAFADVDLVEVVLDAAVGDLLCIVGHLNLLAETCYELAAPVGIYDVPHLVLAHLSVTFPAEGVVGMHLDGEVLTCVNELDEEGEVRSELFRVLLSEEVSAVATYDFGKREAFVDAVCGNGF